MYVCIYAKSQEKMNQIMYIQNAPSKSKKQVFHGCNLDKVPLYKCFKKQDAVECSIPFLDLILTSQINIFHSIKQTYFHTEGNVNL